VTFPVTHPSQHFPNAQADRHGRLENEEFTCRSTT
jgi:hypothetical protein